MRIEVHIEELVLHGFTAEDRYPIGEAVKRELIHLFTVQGVPSLLAEGGEIEHLDGGSLELTPRSGAREIGRRVAGAVFKGLGR